MFDRVLGQHVGQGDLYLVKLAFSKNGYELKNVFEIHNDIMNIWYTAWVDGHSTFVRIKLSAKLQQGFTIAAIEPVDVQLNERSSKLSPAQHQFDDSLVSAIMKSDGKINRDYKGYKNDDFEFYLDQNHGIVVYKGHNKVKIERNRIDKKESVSEIFYAEDWHKAFQFIVAQ